MGPGPSETRIARDLSRGDLVRFLYRLGHQQASGVLTVSGFATRAEVFVLRRGGAVIAGEGELARRHVMARLARLVALASARAVFEGGVGAAPPGAQHVLPLAAWARAHLEAQLDNSRADLMMRELAGMRLSLRADLAPDDAGCDEADRRMIAAMSQPRRLDQIGPLARTPKFRLLAFLHFLRAVGALEVEGIVAERSAPTRARPSDPKREAAARLLGIDEYADNDAVKRAYRRIARSLHPDLQPDVDDSRKRTLERRFAEVTAAYELLA